MTYVAEPYAQFVDDLLTALTGGQIRQRFVYLPEEVPYRLAAPGAIVPQTVRVTGQLDGAFHRFQREVDFVLEEGSIVTWQESEDAAAVTPDQGTPFFVNFDALSPAGAIPPLTDRNPGSITRLMAESFGREFAVLSRQLEAVYEAGFLATASGRDLDEVVRLVGISRRRATFATGSAVFSRSSPAPADIFIPAGTRLSSSEPPIVVFETTEASTLRRGDLSADAPISATVAGAVGVVTAAAITVIHRPILGIESVANPVATRLGSGDESDAALRARASRALEGSGQATRGALLAALTTLPGMAEKDIRIEQDHIAHPGVVHLHAVLPASDDEESLRQRAIELIEETRPAGVRVIHNLGSLAPVGEAMPGPGEVEEGEAPVAVGIAGNDDQLLPVVIEVEVAPATLTLAADERKDLERRAHAVIADFVDRAGLGDVLVYNRLIADLMAIDGVLDVALFMYPEANPDGPKQRSLFPADATLKPVLANAQVAIGGRLVLIGANVVVRLKGAGLLGDKAANLAAVRSEIENSLRESLGLLDEDLTPQALLNLIPVSETYDAISAHYDISFVEAGVRVRQKDLTLKPSTLESLWLGTLTVSEEATP